MSGTETTLCMSLIEKAFARRIQKSLQNLTLTQTLVLHAKYSDFF